MDIEKSPALSARRRGLGLDPGDHRGHTRARMLRGLKQPVAVIVPRARPQCLHHHQAAILQHWPDQLGAAERNPVAGDGRADYLVVLVEPQKATWLGTAKPHCSEPSVPVQPGSARTLEFKQYMLGKVAA